MREGNSLLIYKSSHLETPGRIPHFYRNKTQIAFKPHIDFFFFLGDVIMVDVTSLPEELLNIFKFVFINSWQ